MKNTKLIWSAVIVVAIIAIIGILYPLIKKPVTAGSVGITSNTNLQGVIGAEGAKIGQNCKDSNTFSQCTGVVIQGGTLSTSTPISMTLAPTDLGYGTIVMNPGVTSGISVTLPATTTSGMSSFLPNAGDSTQFIIFNATSTAFRPITIVAGTGTLLETASSTVTAVSPATVGSSRASTLTCLRLPTTDIACAMVPFI